MNAEDCLRSADVDGALAQLKDQVRRDAANVKHRIFLFQLLAVTGDWERSLAQLEVTGQMDAATLPMVQTYRAALQCEALRAQVFAGARSPLVFGKPAEWIALMVEALRVATGPGGAARAQELRVRALEDAPATAGTLTVTAGTDTARRPFAWIADADSRLGPLLELVVDGKYYWAPFAHVRKVTIDAPADLRDFVWLPAQFVWANGGQSVGLIPTRYPGSETRTDGALRLARKTVWEERPGGEFAGLGQRVLATDADEVALMDVREIALEVTAEA